MEGPIRRQLSLLLSAYGYNLYDKKNRIRADDLLVRETAAGALAEAASLMTGLRTSYRRRYLPPPTRENPSPPADRLEALREISALQERLTGLETRIRSQPVPPQDSVWEQFRGEQRLLDELLTLDYELIVPSQELRDHARSLSPETWSQEISNVIRGDADRVERSLRARADLLQISG